jgi:head-tail adaptor
LDRMNGVKTIELPAQQTAGWIKVPNPFRTAWVFISVWRGSELISANVEVSSETIRVWVDGGGAGVVIKVWNP